MLRRDISRATTERVMNPNAPAFTFNPGASSWVPASARAAAPAPEPVKEGNHMLYILIM